MRLIDFLKTEGTTALFTSLTSDGGASAVISSEVGVNPKHAAGDQILAVPTLERKSPEPMRKIMGDLSNEERVLVGLNVRPLS